MRTLEFFFDYGSPYSYLANTRLPELVKRTDCTLIYRPMLLGGVFKATGNRSPFEDPVQQRRTYGAIELKRWVDRLGVPFQRNKHFPINTLNLMRTAHAAQEAGVFETFHEAVFSAFWERSLDMGDPEVLADVLRNAELDAPALLESSQDPEIKGRLKDLTEQAVERGVFGAPTFFVGTEMYFGNDRLEFVEEALSE